MGQFRFLAGIILGLIIGLSPQGTHGADAGCFGKIEFNDAEYGHNYESYWSVWRKPVPAAQAASIKQATVAYLAVPADMQRADSAWREAAMTGARWRGIQVLPMRPTKRKHPEKAYRYELMLNGNKGPVMAHEVVLLVSSAHMGYPNMVTYHATK